MRISALLRLLFISGFLSVGGPLAVSAAETSPKYGCELLTAYVPMAKALAADDLATAKKASTELARLAEADGMTGIVALAKKFGGAADLTGAREVFRGLSEEIEPLTVTEKKVTVMYCPMARAVWVQPTGEVANPYFGAAMLRCGAPKTEK